MTVVSRRPDPDQSTSPVEITLARRPIGCNGPQTVSLSSMEVLGAAVVGPVLVGGSVVGASVVGTPAVVLMEVEVGDGIGEEEPEPHPSSATTTVPMNAGTISAGRLRRGVISPNGTARPGGNGRGRRVRGTPSPYP